MISLRSLKKVKVVLDLKNFTVCLSEIKIGTKSSEVGDDIMGILG